MKIKILWPISKYKGKGIKFLPYGVGQEGKTKSNGRKHIKILLHLTASTIKTLPISWAHPSSNKDSIPREGKTEDGITLFKNILGESQVSDCQLN